MMVGAVHSEGEITMDRVKNLAPEKNWDPE